MLRFCEEANFVHFVMPLNIHLRLIIINRKEIELNLLSNSKLNPTIDLLNLIHEPIG